MASKRTNKEIFLNTRPHVVHAYTHKEMGGDMLVRIQGTYNYIIGSHVCIYLSKEKTEQLIEELKGCLEKHATA